MKLEPRIYIMLNFYDMSPLQYFIAGIIRSYIYSEQISISTTTQIFIKVPLFLLSKLFYH